MLNNIIKLSKILTYKELNLLKKNQFELTQEIFEEKSK